MSWLCRQCETVNTDDVIECEVCDAVSPYLSRFDYDEITPSKPTTIRWKAEECDCIKLHYRGHITDVSHLNSVQNENILTISGNISLPSRDSVFLPIVMRLLLKNCVVIKTLKSI